jgi:hypothetical protein
MSPPLVLCPPRCRWCFRTHHVTILCNDAVGDLDLQQTNAAKCRERANSYDSKMKKIIMLCNSSYPRILTLRENANQDLKNPGEGYLGIPMMYDMAYMMDPFEKATRIIPPSF